jgi:hypothetical protein
MIDRRELIEEQLLRETVRKLIKKVKKDRQKRNNLKEVALRKVIRKTILLEKTPVGDSPHQKTGINKLRQTLKVIVPVIRDDYLSLTTDKVQRDSYIAHLVNGIDNILAPAEANIEAPESANDNSLFTQDDEIPLAAEALLEEIDEDVEIDIGDEEIEEPLDLGIDVLPDQAKDEVPEEEVDDDETALTKGMEGEDHDETGRNVALGTFKQIQGSVVDDFSELANDEDRELYHDYMKTNILLWRDKFEATLSTNLPVPTTPEYEKEKDHMKPEEESANDNSLFTQDDEMSIAAEALLKEDSGIMAEQYINVIDL